MLVCRGWPRDGAGGHREKNWMDNRVGHSCEGRPVAVLEFRLGLARGNRLCRRELGAPLAA